MSFIWPHPYSTPILGVLPLHQIAHVGVSQSRGLKLFGREIIFEEFQPIWTRYLIVTDRRTDRRHAISSPRSALASHGKNWALVDESSAAVHAEVPRLQVAGSHMDPSKEVCWLHVVHTRDVASTKATSTSTSTLKWYSSTTRVQV